MAVISNMGNVGLNKEKCENHSFSRIHHSSAGLIRLFLLIVLFAETIMAQNPLPWKGSMDKQGAATVVINPKTPIDKREFLSLTEEWAIGGAKAGPDAMFSSIRNFIVDEAGNVYVLDSKESLIRVFSSSGRFLRQIGKKGDGPGELASPLRLSIHRTSRELVVSQNSRRITFFDLEGKYIRSLNTGAHYIPQCEVDSEGHIIGLEADFVSREASFALIKFDRALNPLAVLIKKPIPESVFKGDPYAPAPYWVVDTHDNIFFGFPDRYEISIFDKSGGIQRIIQKEFDPVEVKKTETPAGQPMRDSGLEDSASKYHSAYESFFIDSRGYLFVRTWIPGPRKNEFIYDIFDHEGRYLARQPLAGRLWLGRTSNFYAVDEDDEGFPVLKKYAVIRRIQ